MKLAKQFYERRAGLVGAPRVVLQDQENRRNNEPTSAIRAKPFPAREVH